MPKLFDADGNEVEALTKEESEAAVAAAVEAAKVAAETAATEAATAAAAAAAAAEGGDDMPAWAKDLKTSVERLATVQETGTRESLAAQYTGNDAEKTAAFMTKFDRLTGYADTKEGLAERAADAAKLAFGEGKVVDVSSFAGTSSGRTVGAAGEKPLTTELDKKIQAPLGITAAMVEKHGDAVAKALGSA